MGIRYYVYAFDHHRTDDALRDSESVLGPDPLADALGIRRGARSGVTDFRQSLPEEDMLYLGKAWPMLPRLTWPAGECFRDARPAFRMFEGGASSLSQEQRDHVARDLERASSFVGGLIPQRRGFVYMIG